MRTFILAVTGLAIGVAACGSYGTSTIEVQKPANVAAVAITLPSTSLVAGQTQRANVAVKDANGVRLTGRPVLWYTSSASVATVTDSGVISAVSPGTATVSAVSEGVAGQAAMTVIPPPPASVAKVLVAITPSAVVVGQVAHATATLQDSAGNPLSGRTVTWQSNNTSVAAVNGNGDISAVNPGAATITAASEGKSASASLTVSAPAPVPVATVSVSPASASLQVGGTVQLSAVTRDANNNVLSGRAISWSSGNTGIATVSTSGLVTAVVAGSVSVTASSEGQISSAAITVNAPAPAPVASVSVSPATSTLQIGSTVQLSAVTRDANNNVLSGRSITWSSSSTAISSVSASGLVTAVASGNATISAFSEGQVGNAAITVTAPPPPPSSPGTVTNLQVPAIDSTSVSLSFTQVSDGAGQPAKYDVRYAVAPTTWGSATTVTSGTCATPVAGTAIGSQITCTVLGLTPGTGYNFQLIAFRGTLNVDAVFGNVSNVASATTTGSAAPPPPPAPVATVSVSPASSSVLVGATVQLSATMRDASGNVLTGRVVTWSSANPSIASVNSSSGLVTALAAGPATTITAFSETKTGTATVTVQAAPPPPPPGSSNEPSGMTLISERPFNAIDEDPSWYMAGGFSIITDATAPKSPSNILRTTFPIGFGGGSAPANGEKSFSGSRVLYVSYWAKLSANWWGHITGTNKEIYCWADGKPMFYFDAHGVGTAPLYPTVVLQGTLSDAVYTSNLVTTAEIIRGRWFHIEIVLTGNSSGAADGIADWWLDGVHIGSRSGIQWTSGATVWAIASLHPIWGGQGDVLPTTQYFDTDHLYISGKN